MKISQIQSYQPVKVKQNMGAKNQNNTTPAFKGVSSSVNCLPCLVGPMIKYGVIIGGIVLGAVSLFSRSVHNRIDSNFKASIYSEVVAPASDAGTHITEQEMVDYNAALAFYQQVKDEKITLLGDKNGRKLNLLSNWTKFYAKSESEEGMKLTGKEKEQIRFAIDNGIMLDCQFGGKQKSAMKRKSSNLMEQELQRQFMHNFLFNNN